MLVILAVSYFAHIVISLSYFFRIQMFGSKWYLYTKKRRRPLKTSKHFSKFKRHKDTTRVMHTLKCLVFMFYVVTLDYFLPGRSDPKTKSCKDNRSGQICQNFGDFFESKSFILGTQGGVIMPVAF